MSKKSVSNVAVNKSLDLPDHLMKAIKRTFKKKGFTTKYVIRTESFAKGKKKNSNPKMYYCLCCDTEEYDQLFIIGSPDVSSLRMRKVMEKGNVKKLLKMAKREEKKALKKKASTSVKSTK